MQFVQPFFSEGCVTVNAAAKEASERTAMAAAERMVKMVGKKVTRENATMGMGGTKRMGKMGERPWFIWARGQ